MRIVSKALLLAGASLTFAGSAQAAVYTGPTTYFYLTGSYNASFRIDTGSTIVDPDQHSFVIENVYGNYPNSTLGYAADVEFYTALDDGGLEIDDPFGSAGALVVTNGPQLFTGSSSAPTFTLGNFDLSQYQGSGTYKLLVTNVAAPIPEPATWALAILGFGAIGMAMRRANRNVSVRFAA